MDSRGKLVPHYGSGYRDPWYVRFGNWAFGNTSQYDKAMAYKRKRGYGWTSRKRRRRAVPVKVIGGGYSGRRRKFFKKNRFYKKKAFAGSRRWTPAKLGRCIESKMLQVNGTNNVTLTNGLVTTTREFCFQPFTQIIQGTGGGNFTNTCIWFKGIWLQFFLVSPTGVTEDYVVQLDCFKDTDDTDFGAATWTQRTDTGTETTEHFYDRVYGAASTTTDAQNFFAPPNQRGGGPACIFRKTIRLRNTGAGGQTPLTKVSVYLPFNQIVRYKHMLNTTDLTTTPNFWEHGTPVFCLKFYNAQAQGGTQNGIVVSGTMARMYFKDP